MGSRVRRFRSGDHVYAYTMKGGFYAEYVAVTQDEAAHIPPGVRRDEAGALGAVGIELERTYSLRQAATAHRELGKHHVGKAAFRLH